MRAEVTSEGVAIAMTRDEANAVFYALTELGARSDEDPTVRDIWGFYDMLHQVPVEGIVHSGDLGPRPKTRKR